MVAMTVEMLAAETAAKMVVLKVLLTAEMMVATKAASTVEIMAA